MEKHAECAAAISSSGLVFPPAASVRAFQVTSKVPRPELSSVVLPEPSVRLPVHTVWALRVVAMSLLNVGSIRVRHPRPGPPFPILGIRPPPCTDNPLSEDYDRVAEPGRLLPDGGDGDVDQGQATDAMGQAGGHRLPVLDLARSDNGQDCNHNGDDELDAQLG